MAVVSGQPITLSDVTAARQFGLVLAPAGTADPIAYTLDRLIELPVEQPTMCCLGGPDGRHMFITSMTPRKTRAHPLDGATLMLQPRVNAIAETRFSTVPPQGGNHNVQSNCAVAQSTRM